MASNASKSADHIGLCDGTPPGEVSTPIGGLAGRSRRIAWGITSAELI